MVPVKHQLFKNSVKYVKTGNLYTYNDNSGIPCYTKWNIDFLLRGIHIGKN